MMRVFRGWPLLAAILPLLLAHAAGAPARTVQSLDPDWRFLRADAAKGGAATLDDRDWQQVSIPHTYNADDATDGATYRGPAWYRRVLTLPRPVAGQRSFLEFDGAALASDVWINGSKVGHHDGGFARFRFDATPYLHAGANLLAVRTDNARQPDAAPLGGDYSVFGGLYRSARLVTTRDVHFDMLDHGADGVYFSASDVSADNATLQWQARLANDRARAVQVELRVRLLDARGHAVAGARQTLTLPPHQVTPVLLHASLPKPHLWQGVSDPYLYRSELEIAMPGTAGRKRLDRIAIPSGIRAVRIDAERGVLLNGLPHKVHGVNLHQTILPGKGAAVSDADIDADYRLLAELGVTGLRFAHYQHQQHSYDLADRNGYLVWTELPLTSEVSASDAFQANAAQQLRELIRQNYNHPSVFVWGLGNEIYKVDQTSSRTLAALQRLAQQEDPSRPTTYANCCAPIDGPQASHTGVIGSNVYYGWYDGEFGDLGPWLDRNHALRPDTPQAVSEYGAGASALQQEDPPARPKPGGRWHPEQYQALYHEAAWRQLEQRPWLWSTFVWTGFDFPSSGRNEGDHAGINDKGLVSYDRTVRKDAYFWYQANWSAKAMVHITSRRATPRKEAQVELKIYSNQPTATLRLNGAVIGTQTVTGHIARWPLTLAPGTNRIEVEAGAATDTVEWTLATLP
jgi:beta-galactosidase